MIFINTERFSPVAFKKDLPQEDDLFYHSPDAVLKLNKKELIRYYSDYNITIDDKWWAKQYRRCIDGYTVKDAVAPGGDYLIDGEDALWTGNDVYLPEYDTVIKNREVHISGRMYFYLNFWKIRRVVDGFASKQLASPRFLALDYIFSRCIEMMFKYGKDHQDTKGRQIGYSEKVAGMLLSYNYLFVPFSQNIVVAGEQTDADNTFNNCTRGIDNLSNTQFKLGKKRGFDNKQRIMSVTGSEILSENANEDPQALSRYSPSIVICEEVGKGKQGWSLKLADYVKPSVSAEGGNRTGYIVYLGTGGDMEEGVADLQERAYNPEKYDLLAFKNKWSKEGKNFSGDVKVAHFIPKTSFMMVDKDGNPLVKESIIEIQKGIASKDPDKRNIFISANAIYLEDVFLSNVSGYFGPERIRRMGERKNDILTHKSEQITRKGHLEWNKPGDMEAGVFFVDATDEDMMRGNWWIEIVEEPEREGTGKAVYENLYIGGTDTYMQDTAGSSDSEGAMLVYKKARIGSESPIFNTWVALIKERPNIEAGGQKTFFEHTLMTSIYFNCKNNIEYVNPLIFEYYEKMRATKYLMERPILAFAGKVKKDQTSNRYGTDKSLKPYKFSMLRDMLDSDQIDRIYIVRLLEAFIKYKMMKNYNCDISSASAETAVGFEEMKEWSVVNPTEEVDDKTGRWVMIDGVLQRMYA
jgi:hypothetical protein